MSDFNREVVSVGKFKGDIFRVDFKDSEPSFWHIDIIAEFSIKKGLVLDEGRFQEIENEALFRKAKERALYLLDVRDYSYAELFSKLEKNYPEDVCFRVMERMTELGVINDRRYAEKLAEYYMNTKKFGMYKAKMEMKLKGIDGELLDDVLSEYEDSTFSRLCELIEKKYLRYLSDEKGIKKVKAALQRNGYSYSDIRIALDEYIDDSEDY